MISRVTTHVDDSMRTIHIKKNVSSKNSFIRNFQHGILLTFRNSCFLELTFSFAVYVLSFITYIFLRVPALTSYLRTLVASLLNLCMLNLCWSALWLIKRSRLELFFRISLKYQQYRQYRENVSVRVQIRRTITLC